MRFPIHMLFHRIRKFLSRLAYLTHKSHFTLIVPEPTARSAVRRGLLIPLGYLHPGKCEHSEVQSHRSCHGRFLSLCACASHHRFQKYGGLHEERTLAEGFRKGENEDKNDCQSATRLQETPEKR